MQTLSKRLGLAVVLAGFASLLSGCVFPYPFVSTPEMTGHAVDGRTQRGVAGASVTAIDDAKSTRTSTDAEGRFHLPALKHWEWVVIATEGWTTYGTLRIEAPGYRTYELDLKIAPEKLENLALPLTRLNPGDEAKSAERHDWLHRTNDSFHW